MLTRTILRKDSTKIARTISEELKKGRGVVIVPKGNMVVATVFVPSDPDHAHSPAEAEQSILSQGKPRKMFQTGNRSAIEESARAFGELIRESLTVNETARYLQVNPSRVRQRLGGNPRTLYGFKVEDEWYVPRFQFRGRKMIPGIDGVIREIDPQLHPLSVLRWFTMPCPDLVIEDNELSLSPVDWLRTGNRPDAVAQLAADL